MYDRIPPTNNWNLVFRTEFIYFFRFPCISTNRKQSYAIELILREHQTTSYCRSTTIGLDLPKSMPRNVVMTWK